jgi:AcrR family transcriptional regulator
MSSTERREAIMSAAVRLFAARGFRGTTTRELAAAVGVSEPVLYEHFKSKRELFRAIIETKTRDSVERAQAALAPYMERNDDQGFFRAAASFLLARYAEDTTFPRLLLDLAAEGDELAGLFYERQILAFHKLVGGYLARRVRQGAFRAVDPALATRAFLSMPVHHSMLRLFFRDQWVKASDKRIADEMASIFLAGVRA